MFSTMTFNMLTRIKNYVSYVPMWLKKQSYETTRKYKPHNNIQHRGTVFKEGQKTMVNEIYALLP